METKNVNFLSIALRNGILLGLASVAFTVLLYVTDFLYTDNTLLAIITWLINIAISVVFIIMAIEQYKKANEGFLSIGEAIKVGVVVAVIAGVIGAIYQVIYTTIIDPDYYMYTRDKGDVYYYDASTKISKMKGADAKSFKIFDNYLHQTN